MTTDHFDDLPDIPDDAEITIADPEQGYRFAQVRDWITLQPTLDHTAFRVYVTLLAIATRQSRFKKRLTKDSLRWCIPGVKGKPMGLRTFEGALKSLVDHGLISINDKRVEQVRASDGTFRKDESFRFELRMWPADPEGFEGYRSVRDLLDDYPGPGWDAEQKKARSHRAQNSAQDADNGTDQGNVDNSRAQNSAHGAEPPPTQNSADRAQNSASLTGSHLGKQDPPTQPFPDSSLDVETSPPSSPSGDAQARGGRGEEPRGNDLDRQRAARFLGELVQAVPEDLAAGLTVEAKHGLVDLVVEARQHRIGNASIRSSLTNVAGTRHLGKAWASKLTGLIDEATAAERRRSSRLAELPACGTCRAKEGEPRSVRKALEDKNDPSSREIPCPECTPDAGPGRLGASQSA